MDFDNDGTLDFISGSYDPGDIYLFQGLGNGEYTKGVPIVDESGLPLVHHPKELTEYNKLDEKTRNDFDNQEALMLHVASFGSWPNCVDWDEDGDLDILIGSFGGKLFLRKNIGSRDIPKFSSDSIEVKVEGEPLKENCHAAPQTGDWDGDGIWDLIVGSGDGSVGWYRNVGSQSAPKFGPRQLLIAPAHQRSPEEQPGEDDDQFPRKFMVQNLRAGESIIPGVRAQIFVHDYNQDGQLDLLVGDYTDMNRIRDLTDEEQRQKEKLNAKQLKIAEELKILQETLYNESSSKEDKKKADQEYQKVVQQLMALDDEIKSFFEESRVSSSIWLYLRKPKFAVNSAESSTTLPTSKESKPEKQILQAEGRVKVSATMSDSQSEGATHRLVLEFEIKPGWHLYSRSNSGNQILRVDVEATDGVTWVGEWDKPIGTPSPQKPTDFLLKGTVKYSRQLKIDSTLPVELDVQIDYQVCDKKMCLRPTTLNKKIKVTQ
ncbi:MAG: protein-disulfide reductase DsbD domain-containing protein [Planctomycetota bacterium]